MSYQTLSLKLPEPLFLRLEAQARDSNRSIEAETVEVLSAAIADPLDEKAIEHSLSVLDDPALIRAAHSRIAAEASEQLEQLHFKAQREGLSNDEQKISAELTRQYERAMLIRAQAVSLLKSRGHDVSALRA